MTFAEIDPCSPYYWLHPVFYADPNALTVSERGLDHRNCQFSTHICDEISAGQGRLDQIGAFQIPCPECASKMSAALTARKGAAS